MNEIAIEIWTLFAVAVCATLLRMYSRLSLLGVKGLGADDAFVWVGVIFYAAQSALGYEVGAAAHGMANNSMTEAQRAKISPSDPTYQLRVTGSKLQVAGWTVYSILIWSLKLSMLSFYIRLTRGLPRKYRISVWIGFGLVIASFIAAILAIFLGCRPFHKYWQISPDPGTAVSRTIVWTSFAANVSTDIYLILIPIPVLWTSSLKMYKKIASTVVFSAGLLVLVCATLKTAFVLADPVTGAKRAALWGVREAFVAVMTNNLPMIFHLLRTWLRPVLGAALGTSKTSKNDAYKSPFQTIGGGGSDYHRNRRRRPGDSISSALGVSENNSQERIFDDVKMQDMPSMDPSLNRGIMVSHLVDVTREDSSRQGSGQSYY